MALHGASRAKEGQAKHLTQSGAEELGVNFDLATAEVKEDR